MNLIKSDIKTMNSEELANLLNLRHDNVRQAAVNLKSHGVITFTEISVKGSGRPKQVMQFDERNSIVIAAKLNDKLLAAVVDRWKELEQANKPALPQTYAAALLEAGRLAQALEEASTKLVEAQPKVEFVDKYVESTGNKGFRQVAKLLGVKEPWFRTFLTERSIMYKLGGEWTARQSHINAGRFIVKTGTSESEHTYNSAKFTPKGVEWIAGLIAKTKANELMGIE